jgi:hypothetical protein
MTDAADQSDFRQEAERSPFVFGVSGHRDLVLADLPILRAQVEIIFERFRSAYPDASFELLTPLADGADRVTAEAALACDIKLLVPMPMAQAEYERDFTTAASCDQFRRLLAAAKSKWELRDDTRTKSDLSDSDLRAQRYAAVGDYIARKSHVLILLWDGRDNDKVGGTAWVKKRREYWVRRARDGEDVPDAFGYLGTIQVVTPRVTGTQPRPSIEIIGELPKQTSS